MIDFKKEFKSLPKEYIVLIIESASKYVEINLKLLKFFCNDKKIPGIYITSNRPYENIINLFKAEHISIENLFFIDAITQTVRTQSKRTDNCLYISSAESLTEISIAIGEAVKILPLGDKFLFLDSISALLMYNSIGTVTKFAHFLTNKIREWGIKGVLISLEKETDEKLISQLTQFVDKVIVMGGKK